MESDALYLERYKHYSNFELELNAKNDPLLTDEERVAMARVLWIRTTGKLAGNVYQHELNEALKKIGF